MALWRGILGATSEDPAVWGTRTKVKGLQVHLGKAFEGYSRAFGKAPVGGGCSWLGCLLGIDSTQLAPSSGGPCSAFPSYLPTASVPGTLHSNSTGAQLVGSWASPSHALLHLLFAPCILLPRGQSRFFQTTSVHFRRDISANPVECVGSAKVRRFTTVGAKNSNWASST